MYDGCSGCGCGYQGLESACAEYNSHSSEPQAMYHSHDDSSGSFDSSYNRNMDEEGLGAITYDSGSKEEIHLDKEDYESMEEQEMQNSTENIHEDTSQQPIETDNKHEKENQNVDFDQVVNQIMAEMEKEKEEVDEEESSDD